MVLGLLNSPDARKGYVISQVARYLGRAANASDLGLANYARREDVVTAIVAGPEFFAKNGNTLARLRQRRVQAHRRLRPVASTVTLLGQPDQPGDRHPRRAGAELVTGARQLYYNSFVFNSLFQYIPDPSKGVLRVQLGRDRPATNPDPAWSTLYTNQLVSGRRPRKSVLATMMTSPQYLTDSSYLRGYYVSPNVRV